jgi:hypothetical protein
MGTVRLVVSALLLALLGLGSFWFWQEATGPTDEPLAGVVRSVPGSAPGGDLSGTTGSTPQRATGIPPEAQPVTTASPQGQLPALARAAAQVWQEIALDDAADPTTASETPATTDNSGPGSASSGRGSTGAAGEPQAVHRAPVDPDDDDDDDLDDDGVDDDDDVDDEDDDGR